jgi:hypothetical protein
MEMTSFDDPRRIQATLDELDGLCIVISAPSAPAAQGATLCGLLACLGIFICLVFVVARAFAFAESLDPHVFIPPLGIRWVIMMTLFVLFLAACFFIELRRRETIQVDGQHIRLATFPRLIPRRRIRAYALKDVKNLRYAPTIPAGSFAARDSFQSLAFDYDGSTVYFVTAVPEKLSRQILRTIKDRYKIAEDNDESLPVERI